MKHGYENMQIVVVGAGRSGRALSRYFCSRGAQVVLSDRRRREQIDSLDESGLDGVRFDLGGHDSGLLKAADLVVISPGVPSDLPVLQQARAAGVPVVGEVEIAWRDLDAPLVGITGTNGKSTTTALCGEMFRRAGCGTFVGGNLGTPLIEAVDSADWQYLVVELSSFQLETIADFRPRYGMLLNLSADHLDRYADMDAYLRAKLRLFENQRSADVAILNADDPLVREIAADLPGRRVLFSSERCLSEGICREGKEIVWRWQGGEQRFAINQLRLRGAHNLENVMAALLPPLLEGCDPQLIWQAACEFSGLPHRMQQVRTLGGVDWINDSKGTNVGSVLKSLAGLDAPVTLIAGGRDKGGDFRQLASLVREKVRHLLLIGEAAGRIAVELEGCSEIELCPGLDVAVDRARAVTAEGGTVLLSPGCSSFDMFADFEQRGDRFIRLVNALPGNEDR
ncbi:UDP-N-acetylmuramoyl-L-alanine--D-glutamate ligase [Geothermobacter hydrogeniphilus]|uniref:UDP-N-acetylmuramoylalanine--D-glutamate ligase n=1 Tax=Geothermobacter hydrogeniphilus TaxID=1969733 RepID=A0A2K2H9T6_9BACT|nr:UDP-N-acetylmuramoyl-L-alanine--D-glutamate ligase [Geothermobacter hydrogeniphilus]PNU20062.1 UDP-N-acetylmuramoyl-L-alanine--D-glutamate ligase [Geothermobacter hydrogeniphilus]